MPHPEPRPSILTIAPYVGGESHVAGANRVVKLSSNEGAFGPPPGAQAAYAEAAASLHRYPDGSAATLRQAIGARFGLDSARIVCGNGSDEIIGQLIAAYGGEGTDLVMSAHGFIMYDLAGRSAGCRIVKVPERDLVADVDAMLEAVGPRTRLVFLANPNNPTGACLPASEIARLRAGLRSEILLVIDAAYAEYVTHADYDAGVKLVDAGDNTVMTRTFSKIFGLGGLRLGWAYAPASVIDVLNRVRGPFNVNSAAIAAGIAALAEPDWIERSIAHNAEWRERVTGALRAAGIGVHPSEGNFVLVDFATPARAQAADAALKSRGVIVRAVAGYALPQCLRITIGTAEECALVIETLEAFARGKDD